MINNNSGNKNKNVTFSGQCILFLILIQVNVYFFNHVLVLKKYTLTCINDKRLIKNIH